MHSFQTIVRLASVALIVSSSIQAAPTSNTVRSAPQLSCQNDAQEVNGQLYAGDYYYGSGSTKLGYKSVTDASGKEELQVVKYDENDTTIRLLDNVIRRQCNSTALNMYSNQGKFATNSPVKILADVGRDGIPYCVGLSDPAGNPSDIALVPCSFVDDDSQANQFWVSQWKYANLYPAVGKSNKTDDVDNYQPIKPPADDANPAVYTTEPACESCNPYATYNSFYIP
ncbi:uncharacterized protein FA14DRAFT_162030 [Meira miltonrushii]|uniref:Ricin B lectin domain-containing protein n=1 Tax=Meira miltonrushii TaxID=1280837 RepID=A0A316V5C6_9BASI|nr:uncharacterized protein FA14DRAFT_162030 [Meira miltonrushii]PWN32716.1 hypothetical protein FA14DRAFT_162030 [Meira miltonrushii]